MTDSTQFPIDNEGYRTGETPLGDLIARRYSRRDTMRSGASAAAAAVFGGAVLAACDDSNVDHPLPPAPTVTAGSSGATSTGHVVTLTGTATDNGSITGSSWTQTSGPAVTLSSTTGNSVSFVAPAVASTTNLIFQYAATDNGGRQSTATTTVAVSPATLSFTAVAKNKLDVVTVPAGYNVSILYRTGDPIAANVPAYKNDGTDTNMAQRAGDHHDALYYFGLNAAGARDETSNTRGLLVMNHENINQQYLHPNGATAGTRPEAEALKEIECHGVSVVEVKDAGSRAWSYVQDSAFNRRITPNTPMTFSGPVRGSDFLKTAYSPAGTDARGTINNCANGYTPWGTAITCEENWAMYFYRPSTDNAARTPKEVTGFAAYDTMSGTYGWHTVVAADAANTLFSRWDVRVKGASATDDFRNEANQYGWIVEIDPYDRSKAPRKRTALGRFGHEGCWPGKFVAGVKPAWYMGDDARGEYIYKFVSNTAWAAADANAADRLAIGDKYLDAGTLYVAKFNEDGTGQWLPLVFGQGPLTASNATYPFADQADVLVHARLAADALGATPMDRPEWTAINPATGEVYATLTNNNASIRPVNGTNAANPRHYNDPKGGYGNPNGHIIRLKETGDKTDATTFTWDVYLFGARSSADATNVNLSGLTADNDFSSPDGLSFARATNPAGQVNPLVWIQTDDSAYTDVTNCMMLAAIPGKVGDGGAKTVTNTAQNGTQAQQATLVGKAPGTALKRFLVGPVECELTGITSTPDGRTIFVNIQHPGEGGTPTAPSSHWPDSQAGSPAASVRPRSATIVITKTDGGVVGL